VKESEPMKIFNRRRFVAALALCVGAGLSVVVAGCGKSEEARDLDNATGNAGKAVTNTRAQQGEREKRISDATAVLDGK